MRINRFLASSTTLSRRAADQAIADGRVLVNGQRPDSGYQVAAGDVVTFDGQPVAVRQTEQTILLNKPAGYVVSRDGQGSRTVYELLPEELHHLKPIGRLDKDSSGLLLLTTDGELAQRLTHPSFQKVKIYKATLNTPLQPLHRQMISDYGIQLEDGRSSFELSRLAEGDDRDWQVTMHEGRNRQIRRTFAALGYEVIRLHRIQFGDYALPTNLTAGSYQALR
jgi:23S rRNA pseudouridine2605 synthase